MTRKVSEKWDAEKIIEELSELAKADKDGCARSTKSIALANAAKRHFGTWTNACRAAGVKTAEDIKAERTERIVEACPTAKKIAFKTPRRDCQMYVSDSRCDGLNEMFCRREECNFYKPREVGENGVSTAQETANGTNEAASQP